MDSFFGSDDRGRILKNVTFCYIEPCIFSYLENRRNVEGIIRIPGNYRYQLPAFLRGRKELVHRSSILTFLRVLPRGQAAVLPVLEIRGDGTGSLPEGGWRRQLELIDDITPPPSSVKSEWTKTMAAYFSLGRERVYPGI